MAGVTSLTTVDLFWVALFLGSAFPQLVVLAVDIQLPTPDNNQPQCFGISRGKRFILCFSDNHDSRSESRELTVLVVAFSNQLTSVTISSKFQVAGRPLQESFVLEAGGFRRTVLPAELVMDGNERSFKGIEISASSEVSAYGLMYQDFTTDGFLGIPTNNLGLQYVLATSSPLDVWQSQFSVIGTEDSTSVQVVLRGTVTFEGQTYSDGDVLSFMVDKLEAVQIQGQTSQDLTGSVVQTDKPVAIFSGNQCSRNPGSSCDTLTEQLIPVKSWGQNHIYTAARSTDSNSYRIVAYFTETIVTIPGFGNQSLGAGEFWEGRLSGSGLVSSTKPTLMVQQLVYINDELLDPSIIQVPALVHFGFIFGFTTPPYSGQDSEGFFNFISIIVRKNSRQTVFLNGSPINGTVVETDVPNTDYTSLTVQLPKGEGVYYVEQTDPESSPLSVIVYGYENDESYGYAAGLSLPSNEQFLSLTPYYLRELGGEVFTVTVPCVQTNAITSPNAQCKFSTGFGNVLVPGELKDSYTYICITPTFYKTGLTAVHVSLDNGESFPFSGIVYVASEEDLPPLLNVKQLNSTDVNDIIDLTSDNPIILSWDPSSLGEDVSHVTLMGHDVDYNSEGNPVLMEGVVLKDDVLNNGSLTINPSELRSFSDDGLSLSAFYLTPSSERKRRFIFRAVLKRLIRSGIMYIIRKIVCEISKYPLKNIPTGLPPCPCNNRQARNDVNFQEANFANFFFHPGADVCYRSVNSLPSGAGQQCCYGNDGNILVGPPGGGTADRYSPGDHFWKHQWYDVLPWLCLCKLSDNCNEYYKYRPSDDCSDYDPPRPAGGTGDPHLTSLDGYKFTFNGAGEFLMVSSDLHNLTFQARMERYRNTNASVYTAFVLQTNDSSKVQVQMSNMNETLILVDGEPLRLDSIPVRVHHLEGVQVSFNSDLSKINIAFSAGIAIIVYIDPEMMSFIAQLDTKFQGQVRGLLGNLNGNPDDDLQFPNGTVMDPGSSLKELHEFGLEWLVKEDNSIFSYISPFDYSTYHFPEFSPTFEVPDVNEVSQEIKGFCGDSIECVFDAVVTGSLSFANETLMATNTINEVRKGLVKIVSCGFPGDVENGQMWGSVYLVNATVNVTCNENFALEGSSRLTCQADGQWSSDLPVCVFTGDRGDAPKGLSAGVIAAIVVGTLIIVLVVAGVIYFLARK
ncbi:sushi domain-containing protein 2-like isoform X2 [Acanthaster planci]|uniref:Sushi domain-containing protein 2-like isoform X2 n=1 Tax=Acanthaster planci TaxID=133434 RepID=A0A8B7YA96_ACAPL|nr:sushi domain-containing protein 2-like isoform X2 [Acanthaster planci]